MTKENLIFEEKNEKEIRDLVHEFREKQVMIDSDIAVLFNVETRNLNKAMKRNINRFPEDFCFQLNSKEFKALKFQNGTSNNTKGGKRKLPYVYTEQGIIALAGVLKSEVADQMSVRIARVFIKMRTSLITYKEHLELLSKYYGEFIDFKQFTVSKLNDAFVRIEKLEPKKEVLILSGEHFDAYESIIKLVERANESLVLVDPYVDDKSLAFLSHKNSGCKLTIYKSKYSKLNKEEIEAFAKQYGELIVKESDNTHNRYLIIDSSEVYDLGTSLNRIGDKTFTINKIEIKEISDVLIKLFS
jgi:hypothetical protein